MVYVCTDKKRNGFIRLLFSLACLGLLGLVLKTGSRGGLVTIAILVLITFFKTTMANRAKLIACGVAGIMVFPLVVSKEVQDRYKTILLSNTDASLSANQNSALESTNARRELMKNRSGTHPEAPFVRRWFRAVCDAIRNAADLQRPTTHVVYVTRHLSAGCW